MPVVWNTASCEQPTPTNEKDGYFRDLIIDLSGPVGLSRVTDVNVEEWLWRVEFLRHIYGDKSIGCLTYLNPPGSRPKGERRLEPLTPQILRRWVGLYTNWGTDTRQAWVRRWTAWLEKKADAAVQAAIREDATPRHSKAKTKQRRVKA